jgi:hypothetical protein
MDRLLRALSVSEAGLTQMTKADKACCLMEWNDDGQTSFAEIREMLFWQIFEVDIGHWIFGSIYGFRWMLYEFGW